jgi:hypothetical protein
MDVNSKQPDCTVKARFAVHFMISHLTSRHCYIGNMLRTVDGSVMKIAFKADWLNGRASASYS